MLRLMRWWLILATVAIVATVSQGYAQTATITGTLKDPTGGVLPGVEIMITNIDTNLERMFTTDEHGDYTVPLLPPGTYRVQAELSGFRTEVVEDIELKVDDNLRIDMKMQIGELTERLTVTEPVPLVQS